MSELRDTLKQLEVELSESKQYLRIDVLVDRLPQLETEMGRADLWDDADRAREVQKEFTSTKDDLDTFNDLQVQLEDYEAMIELAEEESDDSLVAEANSMAETLSKKFSQLELRALYIGEHDEGDAVCEIHSGAGGTESQDWSQMMLNMYERWANLQGFKFELSDLQKGQEAGISSAEFIIRGRYAYGMLQAERGVHRLVRISPFDSQARRHTSFASFAVIPLIEDAVSKVEIDDKDLRVDTFRASGAGGQHINKTDSAVRMTHIPTGVVVTCQNQRSQHQNREVCMEMLAVRLLALEHEKREAEVAAEAGESMKVEWGSQIRSYVLQPYQQIKDERTGEVSTDPDSVLSGGVTQFMEAWLRWRRVKTEEANSQ